MLFFLFLVWLFADRPSIMESPVDVTVNENESATFNCNATGSGDLTIEWNCSDSSNCGMSNTDSNDGYVTSTFVIDDATNNLTITCVVTQNLTSLFSGESNDVEIRPPPVPAEALQRMAQLIVIPAPTTTIYTPAEPENTLPETTVSEGKKKNFVRIAEMHSPPSIIEPMLEQEF